MRLNSCHNLHQFLTNSRSNQGQNSTKNNNKIYNQSKSNLNIINTENTTKRFNLFSNLNVKQKEKKNLLKFLKAEKNYYNNINLVTEQNHDKKHDSKKLNLNLSYLSNMSKNGKGNSFKTLNYDRSSFVRIMKYFTIKSSNKPMKFDELSPVFIPIRNTLSNEHRKNNNNANITPDNVKDKINFYYYINSKEKVIQLFKDNKRNTKFNSTNNSQRVRNDTGSKKNINVINNTSNSNNDSVNGSNQINNNLSNKNDHKNSILKASDNNLTYSKNSNESEFTFKDKGSAAFNMENKKGNNKDTSNDSSHNNLLNSEINSFQEKGDKNSMHPPAKKNEKNIDGSNKNSVNGMNNHLLISVKKINNKDKPENINGKNKMNNKYNYNYTVIPQEEKKITDNNSPKFINEKHFNFNNFLNKESNKHAADVKGQNLLEKILNSQNNNKNARAENEAYVKNDNNLNSIDNNDERDDKNNLKNSYQFRIRKINLPTGFNMASFQHNNKLLQNIINKKSKKKSANKGVLNSNKICIAQTEYKIMKGDPNTNDNKNLYNINDKKKKNNNKNLNKNDGDIRETKIKSSK